MNPDKTKVMLLMNRRFGPPVCIREILTFSSMSILGVIFDQNLSWDKHVQKLRKTVNSRLYLLRKLRSFLNAEDLHLVYISVVRSIMEYASPSFVGLNKKCSRILNTLDHRAHRIIFYGKKKTCCCDREEVALRRNEASKKLLMQIIRDNSHILHPIAPEYNEKTSRVRIPFSRTDTRSRSFIPFTAHLQSGIYH